MNAATSAIGWGTIPNPQLLLSQTSWGLLSQIQTPTDQYRCGVTGQKPSLMAPGTCSHEVIAQNPFLLWIDARFHLRHPAGTHRRHDRDFRAPQMVRNELLQYWCIQTAGLCSRQQAHQVPSTAGVEPFPPEP